MGTFNCLIINDQLLSEVYNLRAVIALELISNLVDLLISFSKNNSACVHNSRRFCCDSKCL